MPMIARVRPAIPGLALRGHRVQSSGASAPAAALRIGTRGSPLALAQAGQVRARLAAAHGIAAERIALEIIRTTGDMIRDRPLAEAGGKGLFTKEIEEALLAGAIDLAVHSAKDMPTVLPGGLAIAAVLAREDPRDVFISRKAKTPARAAGGRQWSAPPRCAGRRWCCARAAISRWCRCAAMSRPACASSTPARSTPRCSRSPASSGSACRTPPPRCCRSTSSCRRSGRA